MARRGLAPALMALFVATALVGAGCSGGGGGGSSQGLTGWVTHWNEIANDASGLDHTPVPPGDPRVFGEEVGPGRASKALAMVQIAVFEAINAIEGGYQSYTGVPRAAADTSTRAAVAQAAYDTLAALWPSQEATFHTALQDELAKVPNGPRKDAGIALGHVAGQSIITNRQGDGTPPTEPKYGIDYFAGDGPGEWRQDPISHHPLALGATWPGVRPFVIASADQFRVPPPPPIDSPQYAAAYNEVKNYGGDGITTPTARTADQTEIGIYWAYDGTPSLCAPPRLYNQITLKIAKDQGTGGLQLARLLALVNVAMADSGIAIWESKYYYKYWRPVTGIREADAGTGPSGLGDDNTGTTGDASYTPLGAPLSNGSGPNFTPPFPAYPSGHAGFGGALFQVMRNFYGTDGIEFTFVSDEFNGKTKGNDGVVRPLRPRHFGSLTQAEEENGQSRIYLGIHWSFDKSESIQMGRNIGNYVWEHAFTPVP